LVKTIDNQKEMCYNKDTKEREVIKMTQVHETYYVSQLTGEVVETQQEAMELYRAGHPMEVWGWSETLQEQVCRVVWEV